jgi:hypothetical protein
MNQRTMILVGIALGAIAMAFLVNLFSIFDQGIPEKYISKGDVSGMAIVYKGVPYTLSFDQQNEVIDLINRSIPVGSTYLSKEGVKPLFDKFIVYRFGKDEIEIRPITYIDHNLVFASTVLYKDGYLRDISMGRLESLIPTLYE